MPSNLVRYASLEYTIVPIEIKPKDSDRNNPLLGKLVFNNASVNINKPVIPIIKAIFCFVVMFKASGFAKDIL